MIGALNAGQARVTHHLAKHYLPYLQPSHTSILSTRRVCVKAFRVGGLIVPKLDWTPYCLFLLPLFAECGVNLVELAFDRVKSYRTLPS